MANVAAAGGAGVDMRQIAARIERLPYCSWHTQHAAHHLDRMVLRRLRFDRHRLRAAGAHRPVAPHAAADRLAHRRGIRRASSSARSSRAGSAERWGRISTMLVTLLHLHPRQLRLRLRVELRFAVVAALRPGHRARRRGADHGRLCQRVRQGRRAAAASRSRIQCLFSIALAVARWSASGSCRISAGNGCSSSARCRRCSPFRCASILPESPRWLASRGRFAEADARLEAHRGYRRARERRACRRCRKTCRRSTRRSHASPICSRASICGARSRCGASGSAPISSPMASPPGRRRSFAPSTSSTCSSR